MRSFLIFFLFIILGCTSEFGGEAIKYINPKLVDDPIDDWVRIHQRVVLDIPDSIFIGDIKQIEFSDSLIYLLEDGINSSILIFDQDGQLQNQLLKLGNGPSEYMNIDFFLLDESRIIVYDRQQMKFIRYSKCDFSDFQAYRTGDYFIGGIIIPDSESLFLISDSDLEKEIQKGYVFSSKEFENLKAMPQPIGLIEGFLPQSISHFQDQYYLLQPFSDQLFQIEVDSLIVQRFIDFGDKRIPEEVSSANQAYELYDVLSSGSYYFAPTNLLYRDNVVAFNFFNESIDEQNLGLIQNGQSYRFLIDSDIKELLLKPLAVRRNLYHRVILPGEYDKEIIDILQLTEFDYEKPILVSYFIGK